MQGTITQVFENAVQQPTFVAMYADLCNELDQASKQAGSSSFPKSPVIIWGNNPWEMDWRGILAWLWHLLLLAAHVEVECAAPDR